MSAIAAAYGFQPVASQVGVPRPLRIPAGIASGLAANIFKYQPVKMVAASGTITPVTGTGDKIFGIFSGVEYTPLGGRPVVSPFWPTGTTVDPNFDFFAYVWPAWMPDTRFRVQADGAVAQALLGAEFNVSNFAAGNTATGLSAATVAAAGVNVGVQGQFALIEFDTGVNDIIGDAFTDLIVTIALPQIGFAGQTSIG